MARPDPVISIRDVSFSYDNRLILDNVRLDIYPLDSVCVVGPNGGGKSTLMKLIIGLLTPQQGLITVMGKDPRVAGCMSAMFLSTPTTTLFFRSACVTSSVWAGSGFP